MKHEFKRATFTGAVTCSQCGLMPLDSDDTESPCSGLTPAQTEALERMDGAFMRPAITDRQEWLEVDGPQGTEWIPGDLTAWRPDPDAEYSHVPSEIADYCQNTTVDTIETRVGYGARLSAPGYMDCTEWVVFDTPGEAADYLIESYSDDDDDEL